MKLTTIFLSLSDTVFGIRCAGWKCTGGDAWESAPTLPSTCLDFEVNPGRRYDEPGAVFQNGARCAGGSLHVWRRVAAVCAAGVMWMAGAWCAPAWAEESEPMTLTIPADAADGAVVVVPDGTYAPFDLRTETRSLVLRAATRGGVVVDGGAAARCADLPETITLDGFVLRNGKAECGGGVRGGTVVNSEIRGCSATFGGGAYQTRVIASTVSGCSAAFLGTALFEGSAFSCNITENGSADYGAGMAALFGTKAANCTVAGNTTVRDTPGTLASPVQNMIYYGNTAARGQTLTVGAMAVDAEGGVPEDFRQVSQKAGLFQNAEGGDYTLKLSEDTVSALQDAGDSALGGLYDTLWYATDLAGRPRLLGQRIDIGPYEIADVITVSCTVVGVGAVTFDHATVQEGDTVTFTATSLTEGGVTYPREFLGFYVNGKRVSGAPELTMALTQSDRVEARFGGVSATPETLSEQMALVHPSRQEEVLLAEGSYTLSAETNPEGKRVVFKGASLAGVQVSVAGDMQGAIVVNAAVTGAGEVANLTLHRCLVDSGLSGSTNLALTSCILKGTPANLTATAQQVTIYGTFPATVTAVNCLALSADTSADGFDFVASAILAKGDTAIDAGLEPAVLSPYDALDVAGRPRTMGQATDRGAHECCYVPVTVEAQGEYTSLTPVVGTEDRLAGDALALGYTSARTFLGWTLNGEALPAETTEITLPEASSITLKASFAGFSLAAGEAFPSGVTAKDTITLAPGEYAWAQAEANGATLVGTGKQEDVVLSGAVSNARIEAVTVAGTVSESVLNRCLITGGTLTGCTVMNSVFEGGAVSGGTYLNNTAVGAVALPGGVNTRVVRAQAETYVPDADDTQVVDCGTLTDAQKALVGDRDYYGNPRINNGVIDLGAAEFVWPPYTVTVQVEGHGLVSPRGTVEVVRGEALTLSVKADPEHPRTLLSVKQGETALTGGQGVYTIVPSVEGTVITVTFAGLRVGTGEAYATLGEAIAEAQNGETLTVAPGVYTECVDVKGKQLRLVAEAESPYETVIDAGEKGRVVLLADGAEIIGFTLQNGVANEGAGAKGGTLRRCVVRNNRLTYNGFGGGIADAFAESCLLVGNGSATLRSSGGGAANSELLNCTVVNNTAEKGGGLYDCTAKNCVIALNTDLTGVASDWVGDSVEPDASACCVPTTGGVAVAADRLFVNPEAGDFRLRAGVACIDQVDGAAFDLSAKDLAGNARCYGNLVDMGALEWNAPEYVVSLAFTSAAMATVSVNTGDATAKTITCRWSDDLETGRTFTVPRFKADGVTPSVAKITWQNLAATARTLVGISRDGTLIEGSEAVASGFVWTMDAENTVDVNLTFVTENLLIDSGANLAEALAEAIPGETIRLAAGTYDVSAAIPEGVTLEGAGVSASILLRGASLASGAELTGVTVGGTGVEGPENGMAVLRHAVVTGVTETAGAVRRHLTVKSSLIYGNAAGLGAEVTAYLSTVADTAGVALAATAKAYGCAFWRFGSLAETGTVLVDCVVPETPGFLAPAPDGTDYRLQARSPLIDAAGAAQWEGFTDADRALTDLAGNVRGQLQGYDCGAYEYQASATLTDWTWYGAETSMDGDLAGAGWRQMAYGAPCFLPGEAAAVFADRVGFDTASLGLSSRWSLVSLQDKTAKTQLTLTAETSAAALTIGGDWVKSGASALTVAMPVEVSGATVFSAGAVDVPAGGALVLGTTTVKGSGTRLEVQGGKLSFGSFLNVRDTATAEFADGMLSGGELSVAQQARTAVVFSGAEVTLTRLETGDESGARYGDVIQTAGTVTLTGTGKEKQAPLHLSHWSGRSTYSLKGGQLCVPNGEVRLGRDGYGILRVEGGVAKLKSVAVTKGALQLAGGTYCALASQTIAPVFVTGTNSRLEVTEGQTLTFSGADSTADTGSITLGAGAFVASAAVTGRNLTLEAGARLTLGKDASGVSYAVDLGEDKVLTLPGSGTAPILSGGLTSGAIDFAQVPEQGVKTLVLTVFGAVPEALALKHSDCYTVNLETSAEGQVDVYVTRTQPIPSEEAIACPTLTVSGDTVWSGSAAGVWAPSKPEATAACRVVATATASLTLEGGTLADVTFDVAEGKTLTLIQGSETAFGTIRLTGAGAVKFASATVYAAQSAYAGTLIVADSAQALTADTKAYQHLRFETDYALSNDVSRAFTGGLEVAEGKTLTCDSSVAGGTIALEAGARMTVGQGCTNGATVIGPDTGEVILSAGTVGGIKPSYFCGKVLAKQWKITDDWGQQSKGLTLIGEVYLETAPTSGTLMASSLTELTVGAGTATLSGGWTMPAGAAKRGAGTLVLPETTTLGASASLRGAVLFTEQKAFTCSGDLAFLERPVITLPIGATFSAEGQLFVERGTHVVLTGTPVAGAVDLFVAGSGGGLSLSGLSDISFSFEETVDDRMVALTPYLKDGIFGYTIELLEPNVWVGNGTDAKWSTAANWSGGQIPAAGGAAVFPAGNGTEAIGVSVDSEVSLKTLAVRGDYAFSGDGVFTGTPTITQAAGTAVVWACFPGAGSYQVGDGAQATLTSADYEGRFFGSGMVETTGAVTLRAPSSDFSGQWRVASGTLTLAHAQAAGNCPITLAGGVLRPLTAMTVAELAVAHDGLALEMDPASRLTVREQLTCSTGTLKIRVASLPQVEGDWLLVALPEQTAPLSVVLTENFADGSDLIATLDQEPTGIYLRVRDTAQIVWAGKESGADRWKVKDSTARVSDTEQKHVWFLDVEGVETAAVTLPDNPTALTVETASMKVSLSGSLNAVPMDVWLGAEITLAGTFAPSSLTNNGTVIVSGVLDLTATELAGFGSLIAVSGGTIRIPAAKLSGSQNTIVRSGGTIEVVAEEDVTLPTETLTEASGEAGEGALVKSGSGTLYLQPTAFNQDMTIREGAVAPLGAVAVKARYFKFEVYNRLNDTASVKGLWNWSAWAWQRSTPMALADFALTFSGERVAWPGTPQILYFDSGVDHRVMVGVGSSQDNMSGTFSNLFDGDLKTELLWYDAETQTSYNRGNPRCYFVVDAGQEVCFNGYNLATPSNPNRFFYEWNVSASNDLSNWNPVKGMTEETEHEADVWQLLDTRLIAASASILKANTWMQTQGYAVQKASGLWSRFTGALTLGADATLDLSSAIGSSGKLADTLEAADIVGGVGTVVLPAALGFSAENLRIGTLHLTGTQVLCRPVAISGEAEFASLVLDAGVARAYVEDGNTEFVLVEHYAGNTPPELIWPAEVAASGSDGGQWELAVAEGTLRLRLTGTKRDIVASVSVGSAWETLAWTDRFGTALVMTEADWPQVRNITLNVTSAAATLRLADLSALTALTGVTVDVGNLADASLTLSSTGAVTLPALTVSGTTSATLASDGTLSIASLCVNTPLHLTPDFLSQVSAAAIEGSAPLYLHCVAGGSTLSHAIKVPAGVVIAEGVLKASFADCFGDNLVNPPVRVDAGAVLDVNGYPVSCVLTLNGGTLRNSRSGNTGTGQRQLYDITLTANSVIESNAAFYSIGHGYRAQTLTLNGYKLTKRGAAEFGFASASLVGDGVIEVESGNLKFWKAGTLSGAVASIVAEGASLRVEDTRTLQGGASWMLAGDVQIAGALAGEGAVTVVSGTALFSGSNTCTGAMTVKPGATISAHTLGGDLIMESGSIFRPYNGGLTTCTVAGQVSASQLDVDLSQVTSRLTVIRLFTSPNTLSASMVKPATYYAPKMTTSNDGTYMLTYAYKYSQSFFFWDGGATGDLSDATWKATDSDGEETTGLSLSAYDNFGFKAGSYTITNSQESLAVLYGFISIEDDAFVKLSATVETTLPSTIGLGKNAVLELGAGISVYDVVPYSAQNIASTTLSLPASSMGTLSTAKVGTLILTGTALPEAPITKLTCSELSFSEDLLAAIQLSVTASGTVCKLATSYTEETLPTCTLPAGFTLEKSTAGELSLVYTAPASSPAALYAKVPEGTTSWLGLTWCSNAECTEPVTPLWSSVSSVTLTAEGAATLTFPGALSGLKSLTVAASDHTLTLSGGTLPALTTLILNGDLTLEGAVLSSVPSELSGSGSLTFRSGGSVISANAGGNTAYAYDAFTGRWVVETGTTLLLNGGGGKKGQLNWNSAVDGSGQIEVRTGGTVKLNAGYTFGWAETASQFSRTVLVADGGAVEVSNASSEHYHRRTFELKNGATFCDTTGTFMFSRGGRVKVTEGIVTILAGNGPAFACDNNGITSGSEAYAGFDVAEGATLVVEAGIFNRSGKTRMPKACFTGLGTLYLNGQSSYTAATTFGAGLTVAGSGTLSASAVTFDSGSKLAVDGVNVLTLSDASGSVQAELVGSLTLPVQVLKTAENATLTVLPPDETTKITTAVAEGIKTYTLETIRTPVKALRVLLAGDAEWSALPWVNADKPEETVESPEWASIESAVIEVSSASTLTMDTAVFPTLAEGGALTVMGEPIVFTTAGETLAVNGSVALQGEASFTCPLGGTGSLSATGARLTLAGDTSGYSGTVSLSTATTLIAATSGALAFAQSEGVLNLSQADFPLSGAGTLELSLEEGGSVKMAGYGAERFSGNLLVSSGTLIFPQATSGYGPLYGRTLTVRGNHSVLATGSNRDATGWNCTDGQKLILEAGGVFELNLRDTFGSPLEMTAGIVRLMPNTPNGACSIQLYNGQTTAVKAQAEASASEPTVSYLTVDAAAEGDARKAKITHADWNAVVEENACFQVDAVLSSVGAYGVNKTGPGELVLTAENLYTGATTVAAGTLTVSGTTGTGTTTVAAGAVLRGTGTVKGDLVFAADGTSILDVSASASAPLKVAGTLTNAPTLRLAETPERPIQVLAVTGENATLSAANVRLPGTLSATTAILLSADRKTLYVGPRGTALAAYATESKPWSEQPWVDMALGLLVSDVDWTAVESVWLTPMAEVSVALDVETFPALTAFSVGQHEGYTLALTGKPFSAPNLTSFAVEGNLTVEGSVLSAVPAMLSGSGVLTFRNSGEVIASNAGGSDTFAYNAFAGRWVVEAGTTLLLKGGGGRMGQLNWDSAVDGSGQIEVRTGGTVKLEGSHVFGWKDIDNQCDRTVLVLNGGALVNRAANYLRRTIELKNGATISDPAGSFMLARAGRLLVSEGSAEILAGAGPKFGCDGAANGQSAANSKARIQVESGAELIVSAALSNGNTVYRGAEFSGMGTLRLNGQNTYTLPTSVGAGLTLAGSGALTASAVTFASDGSSKLLVEPSAGVLTLSGTLSGMAQVVLGAGVSGGVIEAVKSSATALSTANFLAPAGYTWRVGDQALSLLLVRDLTLSYVQDTAEQPMSEAAKAQLKWMVAQASGAGTADALTVTVKVFGADGVTARALPTAELEGLLHCFVNHTETHVDESTQTATVTICYDFGVARLTVDEAKDLAFTVQVAGTAENVDFAEGIAFEVTDTLTGLTWTVPAADVAATGQPGILRFTILKDALDAGTQQEKIFEGLRTTRIFSVRAVKE